MNSATSGASEPRVVDPAGTIAVASTQDFRTVLLLSPRSRRVDRVRAPDLMGAADLAPNGRQLAISGRRGIWVFGRRGGRSRLLPIRPSTRGQALGEVTWSPDAKRLAYVDGSGLFSTAVSRVRPRRVLSAKEVYEPDWSPRGAVIAFVRTPGSTNDGSVQVVGVDGRGLRTIARGRQPDISPDGARIAFARRGEIYVTSLRGGSPRLVVTQAQHPRWSPDGRFLAFTRAVECGHAGCEGRVFIIPASGGPARAIGPRIFDIGPLSWSR